MTSPTRILAVLGAVALLSAGCGDPSNSDSDNASGSDSAAPAPTLTGEPIVVATVGDRVAAGSDVSQTFDGVEAWAAGVNQRGGIFGRPVEWRQCDAREDPQKTISCVQEFTTDPDVVALIGGQSWLQATSINPSLVKAGMLQVLGDANGFPDQQMPNVMIAGTGVMSFYQGVPQFVVGEGTDHIGVIRADIGVTEAAATAVEEAVTEAGGTYTGAIAVPVTATDYSAAVLQAVDAGAEALVLPLTVGGTIGVINAINGNGLTDQITLIMSPKGVTDENLQKVLGGVKVVSWLDSKITGGGTESADEYENDLALTGKSEDASQVRTAQGWLAGRTFEEILKAAGEDFTRESVLESGMTGTFTVPGFDSEISLMNAPTDNPAVALNQMHIVDGSLEFQSDDLAPAFPTN